MLHVILLNAVGRERVLAVYAVTDQSASNTALRLIELEAPGQGWKVLRVLDYQPDALLS